MDRIPVILDTDIGSDIDDALCLAYLLNQPRCELVGITTVTGEPQKRAMLADALCRAAGRSDVPIYSGNCDAILGPTHQPLCPQAAVLDHWPHRSDFPACEAVEFLRSTIRSRPGEIMLLAVGPMTNIGLLLAQDPEIAELLRGIVLMCGVFKTGGPGAREWNAYGDAYATKLVYRAPVEHHLSVGLDVTRKCVMPSTECRSRLKNGVLEVVGDALEVWLQKHAQVTFHDPLAAAVIFTPELCEYEAGRVEVETQSTSLAGLTLWRPNDPAKPHKIAVQVNAERFFQHYFSIVE